MRLVLRFLLSRTLWTFIALLLVSAFIWLFGHLISFGVFTPLASEVAKAVLIAAIFVIWLLRMLIRQLRAARANQSFVTELAKPKKEQAVGEANVAEVNEKFQSILAQMNRTKLGGRKFLRDMPWYVFIGPPGTGKTTALRQSGLHFAIDLSDDVKGVGGTRNCDWFFTEDAILIDTAGRYVQQQSDPETDAAEWAGFLSLLRKHRGRRALNGVILTISVQELLGSTAELRDHGREARRRLLELYDELEIRLPVYLMVTKVDLLPGFEGFFDALNTRGREQVWGATLPVETSVDPSTIERELRALQTRLEDRLPERISADVSVQERGEMFRFPAELDALHAPLKALVDVVFGENRYEDSPWLRGFYLTSATQEGSPIDRMVGAMAETFGLRAPMRSTARRGETRSYFLHDLLKHLIFEEAGLGTFDPKAEDRRLWTWRGTFAGVALLSLIAAVFFLFSFLRYSGAIEDQTQIYAAVENDLQQFSTRAEIDLDRLDLHDALDMIGEVERARTAPVTSAMTIFGPTADAQIVRAHQTAYDTALREVLEPRMLGTLEVAMRENLDDPVYIFGALKAYLMMTRQISVEGPFLSDWWNLRLEDGNLPIVVFPNEDGRRYQLDAIARMASATSRPSEAATPRNFDPELQGLAYQAICPPNAEITLASLTFDALMREMDEANLPVWSPSGAVSSIGQIFERRTETENLRSGVPGAFTFDGFHTAVVPLMDAMVPIFEADGNLFSDGCPEYGAINEADLQEDVLELYSDAFSENWDALLNDLQLREITDLRTARQNLRDMARGPESSPLHQLIAAIVAETHLTRDPNAQDNSAVNDAVGRSLWSRVLRATGRLGREARTIATAASSDNSGGPAPGAIVASYYEPLRGMIEPVNGQDPLWPQLQTALQATADRLREVERDGGSDAGEVLLPSGGMREVLGELNLVANDMPEPVEPWILGLSGSAAEASRNAILSELNEIWQAQYLAACRRATTGFPFQSSPQNVPMGDFADVFGPSGDLARFVDENLGAYIDRSQQPWEWRGDFGLHPAALEPFERAERIRRALFASGALPSFSFSIDPYDLLNGQVVVLNIDGQQVVYDNSDVPAQGITWPGPNNSEQITLSFTSILGGADFIRSYDGPWALHRMIDEIGDLRADRESSTVFRLTLSAGGFRAIYNLSTNRAEHGLDVDLLQGFTCPASFP